MALTHKFCVIPSDSDEEIITEKNESVEIPDYLMQYIGDSLEWIYSSWNGKGMRESISFYGFSIIESKELLKLISIIGCWKHLFEYAPEVFSITGDFLPDQDRYEKIFIHKEEILDKLSLWMTLCEKAVSENSKILHNGI